MHIVMVHHEELIEPEDVCDLSVTKHHNFQLGCGAFVHNSHIECLLLGHLYKHSLPLIERGHVYIALPPLYWLPPWSALLALALLLLATLWLAGKCRRGLDGYTGDTLGAVQQLGEIAFYLGLAARWPS